MKQRRKQPTVTRQSILDAAGEAFSLHGYAGAGLGSIVDRSGLTKGALFHHFSDKRALAVAWIRGDLAEAIGDTWIAPLDGIDSLKAFELFCRSRCLGLQAADATSALVLLAAETSAADPLLGAALDEVFTAWRAGLTGLLERGQAGGWIHGSIQPEVEAAILVSTFAGLSVTTKCHPDEALRRTCAAGLEGYLETLRPQ